MVISDRPFCGDEPHMNGRFPPRSGGTRHSPWRRFGDRSDPPQENTMLNTIKTVALSALIGFGAIAAMPAAAQADSLHLKVGNDRARVGIHIGSRHGHHKSGK